MGKKHNNRSRADILSGGENRIQAKSTSAWSHGTVSPSLPGKSVIFKWVRVLAFIIVVILSINTVETLLYPIEYNTKIWRSFYHLEPQTVDILIVGNSHAYCSFDTDMIEAATGKKTCLLATASQTVTMAYYNVLEALKYQSPETIILEAFAINSSDNLREEGDGDLSWKKVTNIDGMHFGPAKLQAIMGQYYPENWGYGLLPIARCHVNWSTPQQISENIAFYNTGIKTFKAFVSLPTSMSEETMRQYMVAEYNPNEISISEANIRHFHKLAALCRERGITLQVVMAPSYDVYIDSINYNSKKEKISQLAKSEGVSYLDCNERYNEIGMTAQDFEDLYAPHHHLNPSGANKVTQFILKELYGVE